MQGNQEEETESQQPRVSHPSEAGRRIKEPGGKQKVNNKESLTLESYLSVCLSVYLSIYLSIYLRTHGNMEKRNVNNKKSPSRNLNATLPQSNPSKAQTNPQANPDKTQLSP